MGKGRDVQWSRPRRGSQENWFRIKAESLGQCLWLDPGKEQRGREVGLVLALCFWVEGGWHVRSRQLRGLVFESFVEGLSGPENSRAPASLGCTHLLSEVFFLAWDTVEKLSPDLVPTL